MFQSLPEALLLIRLGGKQRSAVVLAGARMSRRSLAVMIREGKSVPGRKDALGKNYVFPCESESWQRTVETLI